MIARVHEEGRRLESIDVRAGVMLRAGKPWSTGPIYRVELVEPGRGLVTMRASTTGSSSRRKLGDVLEKMRACTEAEVEQARVAFEAVDREREFVGVGAGGRRDKWHRRVG